MQAAGHGKGGKGAMGAHPLTVEGDQPGAPGTDVPPPDMGSTELNRSTSQQQLDVDMADAAEEPGPSTSVQVPPTAVQRTHDMPDVIRSTHERCAQHGGHAHECAADTARKPLSWRTLQCTFRHQAPSSQYLAAVPSSSHRIPPYAHMHHCLPHPSDSQP
jgi:hypothetical protein